MATPRHSPDTRQPCHNCPPFRTTDHTTTAALHTAPPSFATRLRWHSRPQQAWRDLPPEIADWLLDSGSLTQRLRRVSAGRFRVCVLHEGWARPDHDEARILGVRLDAWAWTREVQLLGDDQPWVFARTLIPARPQCSATADTAGNPPAGSGALR